MSLVNTIHADSPASDEERRSAVAAGDVFVYRPSVASLALWRFAREALESSGAGSDRRTSAELTPLRIDDPHVIEMTRRLVIQHGCDPTETYMDTPRLLRAAPFGPPPGGPPSAAPSGSELVVTWRLAVEDQTTVRPDAPASASLGSPVSVGSDATAVVARQEHPRGARWQLACPVGGLLICKDATALGAPLEAHQPLAIEYHTLNLIDLLEQTRIRRGEGVPGHLELDGGEEYVRCSDFSGLPTRLLPPPPPSHDPR